MRRCGRFHYAFTAPALNARMQGRAVPKRFFWTAPAAREAVFLAAAYEPTTLLFAARR